MSDAARLNSARASSSQPRFPRRSPREFVAADPSFEIDRSREKFLLTYFPDGWLRKRR